VKQDVLAWVEANKNDFQPPICNKLMHRDQLSIMFVGGPNKRTDFHLNESSEFFYQMKGSFELPTVQAGKRKLVKLNEGEVYLLPSRIPHSPQRPHSDALGLVVERSRDVTELDGLRWYTNFETCEEILWEKYFHCYDLGRDLAPVVTEYKGSEEAATGKPTGKNLYADPPLKQDTTTIVPDPFNLHEWISEHKAELERGRSLSLFDKATHPDKEFDIQIIGGPSEQTTSFPHDTWLYQLQKDIVVTINGIQEPLPQGWSGVIPKGQQYTVLRPPGSIGMVLTQDPEGNKTKLG